MALLLLTQENCQGVECNKEAPQPLTWVVVGNTSLSSFWGFAIASYIVPQGYGSGLRD